MVSNKAQEAKDRGNAAFRKGDYVDAISQYTAAIVADRSEPTLPLNRAAAYLKLGKYEDAERDCSTALSIKPGQVKALFRRAQARLESKKLIEAHDDLTQALKFEPKNEAVLTELQKLGKITSAASSNQYNNKPGGLELTPAMRSATPAKHVRRRRVPIDIVEAQSGDQSSPGIRARNLPSEKDRNADFGLTPVSSRSLSPAPSKLNSHLNGSVSQYSTSTTRAAGGIFQPTGEHTFVSTRVSDPARDEHSPASVLSASSSPSLTQDLVTSGEVAPHPVVSRQNVSMRPSSIPEVAPTTLFEFTRSWERDTSSSVRWQLITKVPPSALPSLFKTSLEAPMLASFLEVFSATLNTEGGRHGQVSILIRDYMLHFNRVPRFATILLFLSKAERELARNVCLCVGGAIEGWDV